jgi:hypothetical protein
LNPLDGLWRYLKAETLANEPTLDLDAALDRACDEIFELKPTDRLPVAGVLSGNVWLRT